MIVIYMEWSSYLSVNDRYTTRRGKPRLRPEVQAWQEELAWKIKQALASAVPEVKLGPQVIIDITMRFPADRTHDPDNYLKAIHDGAAMGTGIDDSHFIPFVRAVSHEFTKAGLRQAGFVIRLYSAEFAGHALRGRIEHMDGVTVIVLEKSLSQDWRGSQVMISLGVVKNG